MKKGFTAVCNFTLSIDAVVVSDEFGYRGYACVAQQCSSDETVKFFVPESHMYKPTKFLDWLRAASLRTFWYCFAPEKLWQKMILEKLQSFDNGTKMGLDMVETIGWQLPMAHENPLDMTKRKAVLSSGLFLLSDGTIGANPSHYLHPSLSLDPRAKAVWSPLDIQLDNLQNLESLIKAAIPGQLWAYLRTAGMFISHSNSDLIRTKTSQHPSTVLMGEKGVGKSWCVDLCQYLLCGSKTTSKVDPDTHNTTLKRQASLTTFPKVLEDIHSVKKEESLVASIFDYATLTTKEGNILVKSPFIFTTNRLVRCERAGDREVIVLFKATTKSSAEMKAAESRYKEAMKKEKVPVGFTLAYSNYVASEKFDRDLEYWTSKEMEINGFKSRTAWGYALKDCAVQYIAEKHIEVLDQLNVKFPEDYVEYLETTQKETIRLSHIELSRAKPLTQHYFDGVLNLVANWSITERLRSIAVVCSNKHPGASVCKWVIAIRLTEPRFKVVAGISIDMVQRVAAESGVVPRANCSAFLSKTEEYNPEVGLVREVQ